MKLLLVHPQDSPVEGVWSSRRWDAVIDLGWAGTFAYAAWERQMGCPVRSFWSFGRGPRDFQRIREILRPWLGVLIDEQGLDWWEILAPLRIHEMLGLVVAKNALEELGTVELVATRAHPLADLFGRVAAREVRYLETRPESAIGRRWRRLGSTAQRLSLPQILQTGLDKWDMDYRFRSLIPRRREAVREGVVLMPSGYENVTRILTAYAEMLPERKFLLVSTRKGGELRKGPANVRGEKLSKFASSRLSDETQREVRALNDAWAGLQKDASRAMEEISPAGGTRLFGDIGRSFGRWLRIRDAWLEVLKLQQIEAVMCGDENNATNRIPVLLARKQKLSTIHCDHGALNTLLPMRSPACGRYVVKGEMEQDFMSQTFSVEPGRIEVGAPAPAANSRQEAGSGAIVFFSEQYELTQGRPKVLYQELLPRLCALARQYDKRVIVKLHPFESLSSRGELLKAVLSVAEREVVDLVQGPLTPELMGNVWFAVTVESSVSVDCAIRGIPCFLCGWFITPLAGYGGQFVKYGAARSLNTPEETARIPEMLRDFEVTQEVQRKLWTPVEPARLDALLRSS